MRSILAFLRCALYIAVSQSELRIVIHPSTSSRSANQNIVKSIMLSLSNSVNHNAANSSMLSQCNKIAIISSKLSLSQSSNVVHFSCRGFYQRPCSSCMEGSLAKSEVPASLRIFLKHSCRMKKGACEDVCFSTLWPKLSWGLDRGSFVRDP